MKAMSKKIKEFDIEMTVYNMNNEYTMEQINEMFIQWCESKNLYCGGIVKECIKVKHNRIE